MKQKPFSVFSTPTAESWYPGILDTEIFRVKDRFCRDFSGVWKKFQVLLTHLQYFIKKFLLNLMLSTNQQLNGLIFAIIINYVNTLKSLQNFFSKADIANFAEIFRNLTLGYSDAENILLSGHYPVDF